jgi:hypothetical protein
MWFELFLLSIHDSNESIDFVHESVLVDNEVIFEEKKISVGMPPSETYRLRVKVLNLT